MPHANEAALAGATEFRVTCVLAAFLDLGTIQSPLPSAPLVPSNDLTSCFFMLRDCVSFTFYQTHDTCTYYKCNGFSQMTRRPLNGNKKVTSPPECAFARRNLRKVKGEGSGNPTCDGSPVHLPFTERTPRSDPN